MRGVGTMLPAPLGVASSLAARGQRIADVAALTPQRLEDPWPLRRAWLAERDHREREHLSGGAALERDRAAPQVRVHLTVLHVQPAALAVADSLTQISPAPRGPAGQARERLG
jgi:hypothetical protein